MSASPRYPHAFVESQEVGEATRIGVFSVVEHGSVIGRDCDLQSHVVIQAGAHIGDRVTIDAAAQVSGHVRIEDDVSIGANVAFCSQHAGRLAKDVGEGGRVVVVRARASIGANATILPGVVIGPGAVVGAGSVVTRSVPPHAVVVGNPARIVHYTDAEREHVASDAEETRAGAQSIRVDRVQLLHVPIIRDLRGSLSAREIGKGLPFVPARFFVVFDVPSREIRGEHAHRQCEQFLICLNGSISVVCDDGQNRQEFVLDTPEIGLYLPPMVWGIQYRPTERAQLVVLASHGYDPHDYIRNYDDFLRERQAFDAARAE